MNSLILKTAGCILIMFSTAGLGFFKAYTIKRRRKELMSLKSILTVLEGEIRYSGSDIKEALTNAAKRHEGAMKAFISKVAEELNTSEGKSLINIWEEAEFLLKDGYFEKQDYSVISELGKNLGMSDKTTQINILEGFVERLGENISSIRENEEQRCKAARSIGIMSGILIIVLII